MRDWIVYGLICSTSYKDVVYIGITNNWSRRYKAHIDGHGCKFTRSFKPRLGSVLEMGLTKSEALKREIEIKKLNSKVKMDMILSRCVISEAKS